jgi:hypothetical protein
LVNFEGVGIFFGAGNIRKGVENVHFLGFYGVKNWRGRIFPRLKISVKI